jgi:lysyl-tRNA synthetase class I
MSMQHRLPDKVVVHADPWTFYCAVCSETMRIKTLAPSQGGMKTRTYRCSYECACGHRETFDVVIR